MHDTSRKGHSAAAREKTAKALAGYKYGNKGAKTERSCCGIFCNVTKASEAKSKISGDVPASKEIARICLCVDFSAYPMAVAVILSP